MQDCFRNVSSGFRGFHGVPWGFRNSPRCVGALLRHFKKLEGSLRMFPRNFGDIWGNFKGIRHCFRICQGVPGPWEEMSGTFRDVSWHFRSWRGVTIVLGGFRRFRSFIRVSEGLFYAFWGVSGSLSNLYDVQRSSRDGSIVSRAFWIASGGFWSIPRDLKGLFQGLWKAFQEHFRRFQRGSLGFRAALNQL